MAQETKLRSIVKATSYRFFGTMGTIVIVWIATGELVLALSVGGAEGLTKIAIYFAHERVWNKIGFGKSKASSSLSQSNNEKKSNSPSAGNN